MSSLRTQILNPNISFIVQAPAGSGKTELLSQRFLGLLATVQAPEEIIAITFTRKAASEMRSRILSALDAADANTELTNAHQKITRELALKALHQNRKRGWQLLENPNRLRILTIDALSAALAAHQPIMSGFGALMQIADHPSRCYEEAIHHLCNDQEYQTNIETLLLSVDNNFAVLKKLLIDLLSKREQWLPHLIGHQKEPERFKTYLELALKQIIKEQLTIAHDLFPKDLQPLLLSSAVFAGRYFQAIDPQHPIAICADLIEFPEPSVEHFDYWLAFSSLLLTEQNEWRKQVNKYCGFHNRKEYPKETMQMLELLAQLSNHDALKQALIEIKLCPQRSYHSEQWQLIHALIQILPALAAELKLVFQTHGVIDFVEMTQGALQALGHDNHPSELALYLDYRVHHLLIDEFQDTSLAQFQLFEKLLCGWEPNDGRSVFLVGDPMQSIYQFRQAEVGLFLRAQLRGISDRPLQSVCLNENFRARPELLEWINNVFSKIFPKYGDLLSGAVPYSAFTATRPSAMNAGVSFYPLLNGTSHTEAATIVDIVNRYLKDDPTSSIAVLVRSRSGLIDVIQALRNANIPFKALEIEALSHRSDIQDLVSLTRALCHWGDRIAWLSILRAPWCGLSLADLHALVTYNPTPLIWSALLKFRTIPTLSEDGIKRLTRVVPVLQNSLAAKERSSLSNWVQGTWLALGGPACLKDPADFKVVEQYFELLKGIETHFDETILIEKLEQLFADVNDAPLAQLQVMTIHKAKGLEFDHVILPNLHRKVSNDQKRLLLWQERPTTDNDQQLLLAPIKLTDKKEPIYDYLRHIEKTKSHHEMQRLLYVAVTRARETLHLIGVVNNDSKEPTILKKPPAGSFLQILWPSCQHSFSTHVIVPTDEKANLTCKPASIIPTRLTHDWQSPLLNIKPIVQIAENNPLNATSKLKSDEQIIGTIIHEILAAIGNKPLTHWQNQTIEPLLRYWQSRQRYQLQSMSLLELFTIVRDAIFKTLSDPIGQWIFSPNHLDAKNELPVTVVDDDGSIIHYRIDRTFIDANNQRWIIDYKTTSPKPDEPWGDFLNAAVIEHQTQLNQYGKALRHVENRPIKLGLYFPRCSGWHHWDLTQVPHERNIYVKPTVNMFE